MADIFIHLHMPIKQPLNIAGNRYCRNQSFSICFANVSFRHVFIYRSIHLSLSLLFIYKNIRNNCTSDGRAF